MARPITLSEFVDAFSCLGKDVSEDTWIWKDLSLDADELGWEIVNLEKDKHWRFNWETDVTKYLPIYSYWGKSNFPYPDIRLRELFAFSCPTRFQ